MADRSRRVWRLRGLLPVLGLCLSAGCLPDNGFRQVLSENIVQTFAIALQSFTALIFGNLFPVF